MGKMKTLLFLQFLMTMVLRTVKLNFLKITRVIVEKN